MFVGHYSVAFACRTERNNIPLWVLFVAVQFLDYIWATLVLLGIEKLRVIKGFTAGSMLDSYFHPYSHSLITAVIWSAIAAFVYRTVCSRHPFDSAQGRLSHYSKSAPLIIGLAVFSHWILDLVAHPRDLPIYDNALKVGFGLWKYRDPEFALEIVLLAGGIALYLTRNAMPAIRKGAVIAFGLVLVIVQIGDTYVPRTPLTDKATVTGVWVFYTLFVIIAFGVEKIGAVQKVIHRDRNYFRCFRRRQNDSRQVAGARTRLAFYRSRRFSSRRKHRKDAQRSSADRWRSMAVVGLFAKTNRAVAFRRRKCRPGLFGVKTCLPRSSARQP